MNAQLLTPDQAAALLRVDETTVLGWISSQQVPYVRYEDGRVELPLHGLLASLAQMFDLSAALATISQAASVNGLSDADLVRLADGSFDD